MNTFIQHWKLNLVALVLIVFLTSLGFWQLSRAQEKKVLLQSYAERTAHKPYAATELQAPNDWRFFRVELTGKFDNAHTILLDNKTMNGVVGYEVYTPFKADDMNQAILIDRGFIPLGANRNEVPTIKPASEHNVTVSGMLNLPPRYVSLGQMLATKVAAWPLRVEYINLPKLANLTEYPLYPYVLNIDPKNPAAFKVEWQVNVMGPERHMGYAVQWFALALTLLILSAIMNYRSTGKASTVTKRRMRR